MERGKKNNDSKIRKLRNTCLKLNHCSNSIQKRNREAKQISTIQTAGMSVVYNRFRQEELPVVAELLLQQFNRDRDQFQAFSPEFNEEYIGKLRLQIEKVNELMPAEIVTAERKKITADLYQLMKEISMELDLLAAYALRAEKEMTVHAAHFGVKEAKKELKKLNAEGYFQKVKVVEQNCAKNFDALCAKGYNSELGQKLGSMTHRLYELNLRQSQKLQERRQLVDANHSELKLLWEFILEISKIGKLVTRFDKEKSNEYKLCNLLKYIRKSTPLATENSLNEQVNGE